MRLVCFEQPRHQLEAWSNLHLLVENFKAVDSCRDFVAFLVGSNRKIAADLQKNFDLTRILDINTDFRRFDIDLVFVDPNRQFQEDYNELRKEAYLEKVYSSHKKKVINILVYAGVLLLKSGFTLKLKILKFLRAICIVEAAPSQMIQELIYKLMEIDEIKSVCLSGLEL